MKFWQDLKLEAAQRRDMRAARDRAFFYRKTGICCDFTNNAVILGVAYHPMYVPMYHLAALPVNSN